MRVRVGLALLVGIAVGVCVSSYLSMRASRSFSRLVLFDYQLEQRILAARAMRDGNPAIAHAHYANLIESANSPGLFSLNEASRHWSLFFPLVSPAIDALGDPADKKGASADIGIMHALNGYALEQAGRKEEASLEYHEASRRLGVEDGDKKIRDILGAVLNEEKALAELGSGHTYSDVR